MPRRPTRTVPTVLLHGRGGIDPDGWQSWLAGELTATGREVRYPQLPGVPDPTLDEWLSALRTTLDGLPVPLDIDAIRKAADGTVLVGGDDDPACPGGVARVYGAPLKMAATMIGGAGHLTPESGYAQFPAMLDWCGRDNLAFIA
jgi:predicted alpha/beta hydrolase family esterase